MHALGLRRRQGGADVSDASWAITSMVTSDGRIISLRINGQFHDFNPPIEFRFGDTIEIVDGTVIIVSNSRPGTSPPPGA